MAASPPATVAAAVPRAPDRPHKSSRRFEGDELEYITPSSDAGRLDGGWAAARASGLQAQDAEGRPRRGSASSSGSVSSVSLYEDALEGSDPDDSESESRVDLLPVKPGASCNAFEKYAHRAQ